MCKRERELLKYRIVQVLPEIPMDKPHMHCIIFIEIRKKALIMNFHLKQLLHTHISPRQIENFKKNEVK